ncbi:MAG TPA: leucine--tRNA ligase [Candidatus Magasanikbacteria bacterium]|nr:leucine--tRNA ligase [Candidatus Magasanikbacteria bacterium]
MSKYNPAEIEPKWQKNWDKEKLYETREGSDKKKYYVLDMFPYPSGTGLHVGHLKGYIATDVIARMRMMQGYNVLHPMGWDAFGLPAENYAIKNKIHPSIATAQNVANYKRQLHLPGLSYDWSREVNTTDSEYYKWTQWAFIQMYKKGLVHESYEPINWCPECKTGLANEDLEDGKCERCGSVVERKPMRQWVIEITKYADRLLNDLDLLKEWPEHIKGMQRNWIGKSEGAVLKFQITNDKSQIEVFTTRPDTLFGVTYVVLAPEHQLIEKCRDKIKNFDEVQKYIGESKNKSDLERSELQKEKTGIKIDGLTAINPTNGEEVPIFVADYVLGGYGTGAVMAVPAHDERDFAFAKKYGLPMKKVVEPIVVYETGDSAIQKDLPFIKRENVCAIVLNPKDGKYLCVNWKNFNMHGLITGGVEEGEDIVEAVKREVIEESGYKNLRLVRNPEFAIHTKFFHRVKKQNRWARFQYVFLELENEEREEISADEKEVHELVWKTKKEMETYFTVAEGEFANNLIGNSDYIFVGDGILRDSGEFSDLYSDEARKKITEAVGGQMVTKYKLRDWVFSRQRYWGEPIPLVHCATCEKRKVKIVLVHGIYGNPNENWFPWFKKEMEKRGCEVIIPQMVDSETPKLSEWVKQLTNLGVTKDDDLYVVGHSLGAVAACQYILENRLHVKKLILVGPTGNSQGEENWKNLLSAGCEEEGLKCIKDFNEANTDLSKLVNLADERVIYISDNDPFIPMSVMDDYSGIDARVNVLKNRGHFNESAGIRELPEILSEFPEVTNRGWVAVPESELPLKLPEVKNYEPSGTGESPLANITEWVNTKCPTCGGPAKRETNTMPQWAGSCWYYLAYAMPRLSEGGEYEWDKDRINYWNPVDCYVGGAEHATRHLIYARFWHKFLYDIGAVQNVEPFMRLHSVGLILGEDSRKMSKRWGNVINPDDVVEKFGADALRLYEMFMGPFGEPCAWDTNGLVGCKRFLDKVCVLGEKVADKKITEKSRLKTSLHQTIKKVGEDIEGLRYNTAIAKMMSFANDAQDSEELSKEDFKMFVQVLAPFAPHLAEELWKDLDEKESIFKSGWPKYDPELAKSDEMTIAIQVNGKLRDTLVFASDATEEEIKSAALASEKIQKWLEGVEPKKVIYVKGRLVSIVV